jgi:hypothetical protein
VVYRSRRFVADDDQNPLTFSVRFDVTARIEPTGAFVLVDGRCRRRTSSRAAGRGVPPDLRPRRPAPHEADRARSFRPYDVYFLARGLDGEPTGRLVPDRVFLPRTAPRAPALVNALLLGPTLPLSAAVETAVPPMTEPASDVTVADGVVTVDLPRELAELDPRQRQRLSAQFAWTLLPTFTGVRLLAAAGRSRWRAPARCRRWTTGRSSTRPACGRGAAAVRAGRKLRSLEGTAAARATRPAGPAGRGRGRGQPRRRHPRPAHPHGRGATRCASARRRPFGQPVLRAPLARLAQLGVRGSRACGCSSAAPRPTSACCRCPGAPPRPTPAT